MIVRPYEYIVGRLNGKFLPNDPSSYRRSKKNQKNVVDHSYYNHDIDNNTSEFKTVEDSRGHELPDRNIRQQQPIKYNNIKKPLYLQSDASTIS